MDRWPAHPRSRRARRGRRAPARSRRRPRRPADHRRSTRRDRAPRAIRSRAASAIRRARAAAGSRVTSSSERARSASRSNDTRVGTCSSTTRRTSWRRDRSSSACACGSVRGKPSSSTSSNGMSSSARQHDLDREIVGHETAGVDEVLELQPEGCPPFDQRAEVLTARKVAPAVLRREPRTLGALARSRRTGDEHDPDGRLGLGAFGRDQGFSLDGFGPIRPGPGEGHARGATRVSPQEMTVGIEARHPSRPGR